MNKHGRNSLSTTCKINEEMNELNGCKRQDSTKIYIHSHFKLAYFEHSKSLQSMNGMA